MDAQDLVSNNDLKSNPWRTSIINNQKPLIEVGLGSFGSVYKHVLQNGSDQIVALKKFEKQENDGFPITALREIKLLQQLSHKNIVRLIEVSMSNTQVLDKQVEQTCLVLEYMEHDMLGVINNKITFDLPQTKCLMRQLLTGLAFIHSKNIVHRDIKSANILYNNKGEVKLADFGLARQLYQKRNYTVRVCTLWYKPPELLLGKKNYNTKVDMWSLGCFLAELLLKKPLFHKADSERRLVAQIFKLCGPPTEETWPEASQLEFYSQMVSREPDDQDRNKIVQIPSNNMLRLFFQKHVPSIDEQAFDLLSGMLTLNPDKRLSAEQALQHPYFTTHPLPCDIEHMPKIKEKEFHGSLDQGKKRQQQQLENIKKQTLQKHHQEDLLITQQQIQQIKADMAGKQKPAQQLPRQFPASKPQIMQQQNAQQNAKQKTNNNCNISWQNPFQYHNNTQHIQQLQQPSPKFIQSQNQKPYEMLNKKPQSKQTQQRTPADKQKQVLLTKINQYNKPKSKQSPSQQLQFQQQQQCNKEEYPVNAEWDKITNEKRPRSQSASSESDSESSMLTENKEQETTGKIDDANATITQSDLFHQQKKLHTAYSSTQASSQSGTSFASIKQHQTNTIVNSSNNGKGSPNATQINNINDIACKQHDGLDTTDSHQAAHNA